MARYFDVHPTNPQPRSLAQMASVLRDGGLVAYPTDSGFALGCSVGNKEGLDRIRAIRHLDHHHHFTLVCSEFGQLGSYVHMDNRIFRIVKGSTPGPYTFILPATREAPKMMLHAKKRTVGVRVPGHTTALALLAELGAPLMSSSLILPDSDVPLTDGWAVKEELDHLVDAVLDSGDCGQGPTTVVDLTEDEPVILRLGAGDPAPFSD